LISHQRVEGSAEEKAEEVEKLTDLYENGEESISHLHEQLAEWQHMQKVFRDELDAKFQQHTAFRKEQESWRMLRKELDMEVLMLRKQVETLYAQVKSQDEEKMGLETKLHRIEKEERRYHKDAERRLAEMRQNVEEAVARETVLQEEVRKLQQAAPPKPFVLEPDSMAAEGSGAEEAPEDDIDIDMEPSAEALGGPTRLLDFLHKKNKPKAKGKKGLEVRPIEWLEQHIIAIWRSKHESDYIDDNCGHRHQPLPEFVYEYMLQFNNTKPAADKESFMFLDAVEEHKGSSKMVELFSKFLNEAYTLDACNFYVFMRYEIARSPYGVDYQDTFDAESRARMAWLDLDRCTMVTRRVLESLLDDRAIITFNSKCDKLSVKCDEADVQNSILKRPPKGTERKVQEAKYEEMCLAVFVKARTARMKQIKKALFKGKTITQPVFVEQFEAMDPSVPKRHISRIFVEAAKLSPGNGVTFKAFSQAAAGSGLFEDNFDASADEAQRKEDPGMQSLVKDAIKEAWVSHMDPAVAMVMRHLEKSMSHNPKDSASLMILAELRDVLTQTLNSECPGFILNRAFQKLVMAAFKAVVEMTFPATNVYPSTFDHADTFKVEAHSLAAFLVNSIKAADDMGS